jgi:hypothetical protein
VTGPEPQPPYAPPSWGPHAPAPQPPWTPGYGSVPQAGGAPGLPDGGGRPETHSKAIVALVLAVASFCGFPVVAAVAALLVGRSAQRDILASGGRLTGDGLVTAARVIAWINIALCVLAVLLLVAGVVLLAGNGFSEGSSSSTAGS